MKKIVSVVGGDPCSAEEYEFAKLIGSELATRNITVVTGGLGGVMEAASIGSRTAGGVTIGILPGRDRESANPYVDIAIPTGLGEARNAMVASAGEAVVAVGGEFGTLSEIAFALKRGTPVIGWHTWDLVRHAQSVPGIIGVTSIEQACTEIERCLGLGRTG